MAGDEAGRCRLLYDDVDDVVAVEVAGVAEEGFLAVIVVILAEEELRGVESRGGRGEPVARRSSR